MQVLGKWLGRLVLLIGLGLGVIWAFVPGIVESGMNRITAEGPLPPPSPEAEALHRRLVIGDWHADSLLWGRDLTERGARGHVDVPRLIEGNVAIQVFAAVTKSPAGLNYDANSADAFDQITALAFAQRWPIRTWSSLTERALYQAEELHRFAAASGGQLEIVTDLASLDAVLAARAEGEAIVAGILSIEGAHALDADLANLDRLEAAGYRVIGLHHFFDNALGTSLHGVGEGGLTEFGRRVVAEIAARGMVLDLAHSSEAVAWEVLEITDMPIIVSHTGLRSACDVNRNFPDDLMQAIAATGGVIGIGYWEHVTCDDSPDGVARVITAAIDVLGEDHVSLGSDFDGAVGTGFDTADLVLLTDALLRQGATEAQIEKVMGANMLRVLRARLD